MSTVNKKPNFSETEEGIAIQQRLKDMMNDATYNTTSTYSANTQVYPDNLIPFVNKHMDYLKAHPAMDPQQYLSNLRLMSRTKKLLK